MKTKKELNELKTEYEMLTLKLKELSEEELKELTGGYLNDFRGISHTNNEFTKLYLVVCPYCNKQFNAKAELSPSPFDDENPMINDVCPYCKEVVRAPYLNIKVK